MEPTLHELERVSSVPGAKDFHGKLTSLQSRLKLHLTTKADLPEVTIFSANDGPHYIITSDGRELTAHEELCENIGVHPDTPLSQIYADLDDEARELASERHFGHPHADWSEIEECQREATEYRQERAKELGLPLDSSEKTIREEKARREEIDYRRRRAEKLGLPLDASEAQINNRVKELPAGNWTDLQNEIFNEKSLRENLGLHFDLGEFASWSEIAREKPSMTDESWQSLVSDLMKNHYNDEIDYVPSERIDQLLKSSL